jgi:hypothetical protein
MSDAHPEVISRLHNSIQNARSEAAGVEDPSTRRALDELASACSQLLVLVQAR